MNGSFSSSRPLPRNGRSSALAPASATSTSAAEGNAHGRVWVVELVGSEKLVDVDLGDKRRLTVQVRADVPVLEDEAVHVGMDPHDVHVFDAETAQRVSGSESAVPPFPAVSARSHVSTSG